MEPFVMGLLQNLKASNPLHRTLQILQSACGHDLEKILSEIDSIQQLHSGNRVSQVNSSGNTEHWITKALVDDARTHIEYTIIRQYSEVPLDQTLKLYDSVLDAIFSKISQDQNCLPIFTTNYDPAIERFCSAKAGSYRLSDGFRHDAAAREYAWDATEFHDFNLQSGKRNVVLFKMHGSVDWIHNKTRGTIVRSQPFHQMIDQTTYNNVMIYPATNKIAKDDPYYTAYDYYGRCCERSQLCIVIGYSFRDYDALSKLRSAAASNPSLKLLVIDPNADSLCQGLRAKGVNAEPLTAHFGKEARVPHLPSSSKELSNLEALASLSAEADYLQAIRNELAALSSVDTRRTTTETPTPSAAIPAGQSPN